MTDAQDPQKLAQNFLDLWEKQLQSMVQHPETTEQMLKALQNMPFPFGAAYDAPSTPNRDVSEYSDDELLELDRRLHACEERITALESKSGGTG